MAVSSNKDYTAIAASRITSPSKHTRPPRILIYSRNKKGKTTFCISPGQGNVLILDPEDGTEPFKKADPHVWPITKWEDLDEVYKYLRLGKHPYAWVAVDGLTRISNMALRYVMQLAEERSLDSQPVQVGKQHYGRAGELVKGMLLNFNALPIGVIYTAQERQQESSSGDDEDEEATESAVTYVPDLPKGVRGAVNSLVDIIGRLYVVKTDIKVKQASTGKVIQKTVNQRRLWIATSTQYDTGARSDYPLPDYLKNPTVANLTTLIRTGKATANG